MKNICHAYVHDICIHSIYIYTYIMGICMGGNQLRAKLVYKIDKEYISRVYG